MLVIVYSPWVCMSYKHKKKIKYTQAIYKVGAQKKKRKYIVLYTLIS